MNTCAGQIYQSPNNIFQIWVPAGWQVGLLPDFSGRWEGGCVVAQPPTWQVGCVYYPRLAFYNTAHPQVQMMYMNGQFWGVAQQYLQPFMEPYDFVLRIVAPVFGIVFLQLAPQQMFYPPDMTVLGGSAHGLRAVGNVQNAQVIQDVVVVSFTGCLAATQGMTWVGSSSGYYAPQGMMGQHQGVLEKILQSYQINWQMLYAAAQRGAVPYGNTAQTASPANFPQGTRLPYAQSSPANFPQGTGQPYAQFPQPTVNQATPAASGDAWSKIEKGLKIGSQILDVFGKVNNLFDGGGGGMPFYFGG